ncbi:MAG: NADH-quinone oxidoreductase subunit L [Bacteroidota bacterium]|nr:NADH-quinone oxidoreductase subunit L [Bacteroidota bacterium]
MDAIQLIYLVPLLPLIGFLINGLGRKKISKSIIGVIGSGVIFISFCISVLIFLAVSKEGFTAQTIHYFDFINVAKLHIAFEFQVDQLTSLFLLIITGVGFLIHVYSVSYMKEETQSGYGRYFSYLNLFVFSMLLLVLGGNYLIMFMGWEGVGLCSYLLIGFWFKENENNNAAKKAFVMNRIGDVGFLLAMFWLISTFGTLSYHELYNGDNGIITSISTINSRAVVGISLLLFVGAIGKSAQIPLYTWLPDAMAGPTPVSALIHAATMVTAGIYMIARSNILYSLAPITLAGVASIGIVTAIVTAIIALKQNDIKKVLAYSTVSQLGYMFLGLGVGAYSAAVFHVMTHAFFKALLFLGAGSVIHAMGGEQDIRKMGGLGKKMRITYITFFIACLAIAGIPPFSGFFSKDEILNAAFANNPLLYIIGLGGALLTAFYMFRLLALTFTGKFRGTDEQLHHVHESSATITIPLIILAVLAAVGGFVGVPEIFMKNGNKLGDFLNPVFEHSHMIAANNVSQQTEWILVMVSVILIVIVSIWAWNKFKNYAPETAEQNGFVTAIKNKFYIDEAYNRIIVKPLRSLSNLLNNVIDKKGIDGIVNGVGRGVNYGSRQLRLLQSGQVGSYILLMVIGLLLLFIIQLFTK